ncbi:MAG: hypothetical protein EOO19_13005, partial [Chryseobacterium sp.]
DMIKGLSGHSAILSQQSFQTMFTPQFSSANQPAKLSLVTRNKGILWNLYNNGTIGHDGDDPGVSAFLVFNPKTGLGGTKICFDALMNDAIDFYPEYTGTGLLVLLKPDEKTLSTVTKSAENTYQYVNSQFQKQYGIQWLQPLGFNNSYALMMRKKQAEELKIKTISDLKNFLNSK